MRTHIARVAALVVFALGLLWACPFDSSLREYLSARFWHPFAKRGASFERPNVRRIFKAFAGTEAAEGRSPLEKLRRAYYNIAGPESITKDIDATRVALGPAQADRSLTRKQREEVELIAAKVEMRAGESGDRKSLGSAKSKLEAFLRKARSPEYLSEARGWLGRVHYLLGNQTAAGKIYLDELNRDGSNLTREALLNSLQITYGYDGGPELFKHLEEYFDTPEHAAFAIQVALNPHWEARDQPFEDHDRLVESYVRIQGLLEKHSGMLRSNAGANAIALLSMRTALRMGDPLGARKVAEAVPEGLAIRQEVDYLWMSAAAYFLTRDYAAAEQPLMALFRSRKASVSQKAAAAYGLCGVYRKLGNAEEQLRFALWLHSMPEKKDYGSDHSRTADFTVYWAFSGFDLSLLLEFETPIDALRSFIHKNPKAPRIHIVQYSLAVRLAREDLYEESAGIYESLGAMRRAERMRRLAAFHSAAHRSDASAEQRLESMYRMAEYLRQNGNRLYFNDKLWDGYQRYGLSAPTETRMTRAERDAQIAGERKLKDDQEERWRAYLILREVIREAGSTPVGRRAAQLAIACLRGINAERFEREDEIRNADIELSRWLRR